MTMDLPTLGLMRRYLTVRGWTPHALVARGLDVFTRDDPDFGELEIVLPTEPSVAETERRIAQALQTLSDLREEPIATVAAAVRALGYDVIAAALPNAAIWRDSTSLRVAQNIMRQARDMLASAAIDELERSAVPLPAQQARAYADDCRFGHTFHGSFGFRILSPVGPHAEHELDPRESPPPVARRIVSRVSDGLHAAAAAAAVADIAPLQESMYLGLGLDSDGYDALARLLEKAEADTVAFTIDFSPEWRLPSGALEQTSIVLPTASGLLIREAARSMRRKPPETSTTVRGRVVRLASEHVPDDLFHPGGREIGVRWLSDDFGEVTVRVRLGPEAYREAWEAHGLGREVEVTGNMELTGAKNFSIIHVQAFRAI